MAKKTSDTSPLFKKVLFGFAFSPNLENNLFEVLRVCRFLGAELTLLHVGACTADKKQAIDALLKKHLRLKLLARFCGKKAIRIRPYTISAHCLILTFW